MAIRAATRADADHILRVQEASVTVAYADMLDNAHREEFVDIDPESLSERLERATRTDDIVYLVAEETEVVGFVQVLAGASTPDNFDADAFLQSLYVVPDCWREGVGSELLTEALSRLPETVDDIALAVFSANNRAKQFYERHGFEQSATGSYEIGGTSYETDRYRKQTK